MPFFETNDHTSLYYRDWGTGSPVVFVAAWSLPGAMWEYQMLPLSDQGLRCIAYDRRGHGRSDDPGSGYEFDTLSDDLAALLAHLDLQGVTLVGNSTGCCEIIRYLWRHSTDRIARVVLTSTRTPFLTRTEDNPEGVPKSFFDQANVTLTTDRPLYMESGAIKYFGLGSTWPIGAEVLSSAMVQWMVRLILEVSPKAILEFSRATNETDFRPEMSACTVPTLVIHGEKDQGAPLDLCGRRTAQAIEGSQLKVYEGAAHGLFLTHRDRLTRDLLDFIRG
jgi:non-heme chloroperoxidase